MTQKRYAATNKAHDKHNLLDDPAFPAAVVPADAGIYRGVRVSTGVVAGTIVVSIQMGSGPIRSWGLLAGVSGDWLRNSMLVERN